VKTFVTFPRCVELTGLKRQPFATPLTAMVDGKGIAAADVAQFVNWIVIFRIGRDFPFVSLSLAASESRPGRVLSKGNAALTAAMKYWGDSFEENAAAKSDSWYALAETDARGEDKKKFSVIFEVDTRDKRFRELVGSAAGGGATIPVLVNVVGQSKSGDVRKTVDGRVLEIQLPVGKLEPYDGIVGIDFGNTNTTVVAMGMVSGETPQAIPCEQFLVEQDVNRGQAKKEARPVPTIMEIVRRSVDGNGVPQCAVNYGKRAASSSSPNRVLMGAKRMLSDLPEDNKDKTIRVSVGDTVGVLPAHEPAELFVSKMLEAFIWYTEKRPDRLAITCPSTFSATEVERLKATVINARSRALREAPRLNPSAVDTGRLDGGSIPFVKTCLDEATAAAFFFASREAIEAPGGLHAFNYIYPDGMNILVYDCGGGTTDITLAKLDVVGGSTLDVKILGRVGHRTFGGDFITRQYFRVLKVLVCLRHVEQEFGGHDEAIARTFERLDKGDLLEKYCPTRFDRSGLRTEDVERKQRIAWSMWDFAEKLKCLGTWCNSQDEAAELDLADAIDGFVNTDIGNGETIKKALSLGDDTGLLKTRLQHPDAPKWIEALIQEDLDATITCANNLIESKLGREAVGVEREAVGDVHAVYLVGNASRFPLIRKRITNEESGLRVRFLAERIRDLSNGLADEDLKGCVAKGAAIATRCNEVGVNVVWDKQLMNKLPYDVVYDERAAGASLSLLFEQGENRDDLQPADIEILGSLGSRLFVKRRWPGEPEGEPYISFAFDRPMEPGTYLVAYDLRKRQYKACHQDRPSVWAWGKPETSPPFVSPVQSGEL
jgi:hypothetical protein